MVVHKKTGIGDGLAERSTAMRELTAEELDAVSGGGEGGDPPPACGGEGQPSCPPGGGEG